MSNQVQTPTRSSFPVVVAIIGVFLLFWFLSSRIYVNSSQADAGTMPSADVPSLAEHSGKAQEKLANTEVIDAAADKVRLSIARAKEIVIAENAR